MWNIPESSARKPSSITGTILADFAIVATEKERPTDKDALMLYFLRESATDQWENDVQNHPG